MKKVCQGFSLSSLPSPSASLSSSLPSSLAFIAIKVDSVIVNKPHIFRPVTYTATIKHLCLG